MDRNGKTASCVGDIGGYREIREEEEGEGYVEEDSLDEKEKEWDRSIESESVSYRYLIRHHKMAGYSRYKYSECKCQLREDEVRYDCVECEGVHVCVECVRKKEFLNVEGHDWRHEFTLEMSE